jgi:alpha-amylase/alpha-mannosidase (GH57 family)
MATPIGGDVDDIAFALVLNLHQPHGNLDDLLSRDPWAAREILYALDRIPRSLWPYPDKGRVHLSLSGTLLETLSDPAFQARAYGIIDCGALLWHLQNTEIIDILGSAYYHPVLPLVPPGDWPRHLSLWRHIGERIFARPDFSGFWPPEMGFTGELIPLIRSLGYRYVIIDSSHVEPVDPMRWDELRYRPHVARHDGAEITVVVRDRELSDAQEAGLEASWFIREVQARTRHCDFTPLVTTCTDGDNGGWFRNTAAGANFWTGFYTEFLDRVRGRDSGGIRPVFIHEHLAAYPPHGEVRVRAGAWNTGWHDGTGFIQWTGSTAQRDALARIHDVSRQFHAAASQGRGPGSDPRLEEASRHLLRAQTSCNLYWGESWVPRCHVDLDRAQALLAAAPT